MDPLAKNQPRKVQITSSEVIIGRSQDCDLRVSKALTWVSNKHFTVGCAHTPEQTSAPEPWQHRHRLLVTFRGCTEQHRAATPQARHNAARLHHRLFEQWHLRESIACSSNPRSSRDTSARLASARPAARLR